MIDNKPPKAMVTLVDLTGRYGVAGGTMRRWIAEGAFPKPTRRLGTSDVWEWTAIEQAEQAVLASGKRTGFGRVAALARRAST